MWAVLQACPSRVRAIISLQLTLGGSALYLAPLEQQLRETPTVER
jgi:hypothetical protein